MRHVNDDIIPFAELSQQVVGRGVAPSVAPEATEELLGLCLPADILLLLHNLNTSFYHGNQAGAVAYSH